VSGFAFIRPILTMKSDRSDVQDVPQVAGPTTFGPSVLPFLRRRHLQHRAAGREGVGAGQQRVVHHVGFVEDDVACLDRWDAQRGGVFSQQIQMLHDVELQVAHAKQGGDWQGERVGWYTRR
jgi:hypothetical protein